MTKASTFFIFVFRPSCWKTWKNLPMWPFFHLMKHVLKRSLTVFYAYELDSSKFASVGGWDYSGWIFSDMLILHPLLALRWTEREYKHIISTKLPSSDHSQSKQTMFRWDNCLNWKDQMIIYAFIFAPITQPVSLN